jgi:transcriptional regulator with GAF, ATPase, and Fis domain
MPSGGPSILFPDPRGPGPEPPSDAGLAEAARGYDVVPVGEEPLRGRRERRRSEPDGLFEHSPGLKAIREIIRQVADTDVTVLVRGESGVGKELVARGIHDCSSRRGRPLVKVNCAALPGALLESELFGHERGAFTGAHKRKPGKFELADGGTIFLDEIGEMPLPLQAKLLHVLQDGEFARLGSGLDIRVDVRVVASTNRDLEQAVAQGLFREDLYYRLNVINILVPPLRDRPEEIPILAEHFWQTYSRQYNRQRVPLSRELLERLLAHSWPGNVRELENLVKRIVLFESEVVATQELTQRESDLEFASRASDGDARWPAGAEPDPPPARPGREPGPPWSAGLGLKEIARRAAREAERRVMKQVLEDVRWNRAEAARQLKISYKALLYKIRLHQLATLRPR